MINYTATLRCRNGEIVRAKDYGMIRGRYITTNGTLRKEINRSCRLMQEPFCSDKSDVTPETCSWACSISWPDSWPCPGEARCIARGQICDGFKDCGSGQDEDINLCSEDFCRNGYVPEERMFERGMSKNYIFSWYRYPNVPPNSIGDLVKHRNMAYVQNYMTPKCNHSTKCIRRNHYGSDSERWIEC